MLKYNGHITFLKTNRYIIMEGRSKEYCGDNTIDSNTILSYAFKLSKDAYHKFINKKRVIMSDLAPIEYANIVDAITLLRSEINNTANGAKFNDYIATIKRIRSIGTEYFKYCIQNNILSTISFALKIKMPFEARYETIIMLSNLCSVSAEYPMEFQPFRTILLGIYSEYALSYSGNNLLLIEVILWCLHNLIDNKECTLDFQSTKLFDSLLFLSSTNHSDIQCAIYHLMISLLTHNLSIIDYINQESIILNRVKQIIERWLTIGCCGS